MKFELINSIKSEIESTQFVLEVAVASPIDAKTLLESADKYIGAAIGALKNGKNPFETMPGSEEVIAGLMLLASDSNRQALNINPKKFDLVSQKASDSKAVQKYVAQIAQNSGQSLIKNLPSYVTDENKREVLAKKLVQLQTVYSVAKHKASAGDEISRIAV